MRELKTKLSDSRLDYNDKCMLWSAFTLAFFGFLRVSEYTSPSRNRAGPLILGCVKIDQETLKVSVIRDKTNQLGTPVTLTIAATNRSCCAVRAFRKYIFCRLGKGLAGNSPLYVSGDGSYLTRQRVNQVVKDLLGVSFKSHSFRIGAATTAAEAGIPVDLIRILGR
ncbi:hypothetical protein BV898_06026 [Hypsibius exemplaris]|uniref:Tyr recombinase domain-containing protein n=1 Tax=Hypsibius exemplaris TaxID=2072580 RepID=A0A1W0WY26_HYPEX|nr:hypothetical protein BV898_06026 [Hypsibius exemplaris]